MAVPGSAPASRSDGKTALLYQFQDRDGTYHFAGEDHIDGVLIGAKWTIGTLTYSFPASGSFYEGSGYEENPGQFGDPLYHQAFNPQQQEATRYTLDLVASYTNLNFQEITETATTHAELRFSQTFWKRRARPMPTSRRAISKPGMSGSEPTPTSRSTAFRRSETGARQRTCTRSGMRSA